MRKLIILCILVGIVAAGCAVRRPPFAPHRTVTEAHVKAASKAQCLECHNKDLMPHDIDRGDCLKCHRLEMGK